MKKIHLIFLSLFVVWGCGGDGESGDSTQAPVVSGGSLSITWNMSQSATVEENSDGATLIDATLNNSTAKLSFSLSGTDSSKFSVSNGYLVFTDTPDYENPLDSNADNSYTLTLNASGAGISSSHSFSFNVSNVNEAPSLVTDSSTYFQVNENLTEVKQIVASDPENDTLVFLLQDSSGSDDEGLLQIDSSSGIVSFKTAPNFELPTDIDSNNTFIFTVAVSDGSFSTSKKYYATVTDVKENPTDISIALNSVQENILGANFGVISLVDEDPVGITDISISGADSKYFEVSQGFNLKFKSNISSNYENKSSYTITITATDKDAVTLSKSVTLNVIDVNEAPSFVNLAATASAPENQTSAVTVSASDQEGNSLTYSLTGTDASSLAISSSGVITFNAAPNYESKTSYSISVNVSDGTNTTTQALIINIANINEVPLIENLAATASAPENQTSAVTVSASDQEGNSLTYSLTGTDASSLAISSSGVITFNAAPNYESKTSYSISVNVSDGTNTTTQALIINVSDVNETPTDISLSKDWVTENFYGAVFGTLSVTDPDSSDTVTLSLSGADSSLLEIDAGNVLKFKDNVFGNYEAQSLFYPIVTATDSGSNTYSEEIALGMKDVNETATFTNFGGTDVAENSSGYIWFSAIDQEGEPITYSIVSGGDSSLFSISTNTLSNGDVVGYLTFNRTPDYEIPTDSDSNNTYEVSVKVSDKVSVAILSLVITVVDVNEPDALSVPENVQTVETQE